MSNWGDDIDEELQKDVEIEVGPMFSFKSMSHVIERINNETREWDDKHPKGDLMKIWFNVMIIFFVLFTFTYSILAVATGIFYFFYGYVLFQLGKAWKRFKYSGAKYWIITILTLVVLFIAASFLRNFIFEK